MSIECQDICPDWASACDVKVTSLSNEDVNEKMTPIYKSISSHFKKDIHVNLWAAWVNYYQRGCYQEIHDHVSVGCDLSGVMFLNDGPDFSKFYFFNRLNTNLTTNLSDLLDFEDSFTPFVNVGDVLVFPSSLCHGVSQHRSDTVRRTFSFNIQIVKP